VNHAGFDDVEKNSLDNDCHYKKKECKCMNTCFWWCQKYNQTRLLQETFKVKQIEIASRLIQGQANKIKKKTRP